MEKSNDNLYSLDNFKKGVASNPKLNEALLHQSGNSDVDINITIDTMPIAYAMLCSLLATKQISNEEFNSAVRKLDDLTFNKSSQKSNTSHEKRYKERNWRRY